MVMKSVAFGERDKRLRKAVACQLTQNPERLFLSGFLFLRLLSQGFYALVTPGRLCGQSEIERPVGRTLAVGGPRAENSATLVSKRARQLTTLLPSHLEGNAIRNVER